MLKPGSLLSALLLTGFALFASQTVVAQAPPRPDHKQLGSFEWESTTGHVVIQYAREHESLIVTLNIPGGPYIPPNIPGVSSTTNTRAEQLRSRISAEQLKVWVLTDEGGALARSRGQSLEPVTGIGNAGDVTWIVSFTFTWTPSTGISAVVLKAGERDYLFKVTGAA